MPEISILNAIIIFVVAFLSYNFADMKRSLNKEVLLPEHVEAEKRIESKIAQLKREGLYSDFEIFVLDKNPQSIEQLEDAVNTFIKESVVKHKVEKLIRGKNTKKLFF